MALERHGVSLAFVAVFRPALRIARIAHGEECQVTVAQAVQAHIDQGANHANGAPMEATRKHAEPRGTAKPGP
jgi:hypothetical protein